MRKLFISDTANLLSDSEIRKTWSDNLAMAYKDAVHQYKHEHKKTYLNTNDYHIIANNAAEYFLQLLAPPLSKGNEGIKKEAL